MASYFQFVPLEEEILDFFSPVARHILTLLQGKPCIPVEMTEQETSSYNWVLPSQTIFCQDSTTRDLITPTLLEEHLGLRYIHSEIAQSLNPTLRSRLGIETLSSKHLLEIAKAEVKKFAVETDASASENDEQSADVAKIGWLARWLQCMFKCLGQERNSSQDTLDSIASLDVIPLTNGTFVNLKEDSVFLPLSMDQSPVGTKKTKSTSSKSYFYLAWCFLLRLFPVMSYQYLRPKLIGQVFVRISMVWFIGEGPKVGARERGVCSGQRLDDALGA